MDCHCIYCHKTIRYFTGWGYINKRIVVTHRCPQMTIAYVDEAVYKILTS